MPPKLAPKSPKPPKPTLGAEPGPQLGEAYHGTSESYLPVPGPNSLDDPDIEKVINTFYWYKFNDRPLMRTEVQGMLSRVYRVDKNTHFMNIRFEKLEKQVKLLGAINEEKNINKENPDRVRAEVDAMFKSYCDADKSAKAVRDVLEGLKVRLPNLDLPRGKPLVWGYERIRTDQFCCLYGLANWCKTEDDLLPAVFVYSIATIEIFGRGTKQNTALIMMLRDREHELTKRVHGILESHEDIKSHFWYKALGFYRKYEGLTVTPLPIPDPAEDPLTATTSEFSALTMTATAGPSRQSGRTPGKATSEKEWSPLHDFDTESASAGSSRPNASPLPKQSRTDDPHHTAKRRARESTTESSSPSSGAGASKGTKDPKEKGKGKEPQGKRQRGSGQGKTK